MSSIQEPSPLTLDAPSLAHAAGRTLDILLAAVALVLLLPLMAVIAVAIRLDTPGPALFRQRRVGRDMRPFTMLKFRSMHASADCEPHRAYVCALIAGEETGDDGLYKLVADQRVTAVGGLLRRTSLDELPQLWNILRGEMSLVGPRPVIDYEVEGYPNWYLGRFAVRPGLTGLWQVSGRSERTYTEMIELDLDYVRRRSLGLDLRIIAKTVWVVGRRRGAA